MLKLIPNCSRLLRRSLHLSSINNYRVKAPMEVISSANDAVQANERLRRQLSDNKEIDIEAYQQCCDSLDMLRDLKGNLEDRGGDMKPPTVDENILKEIKMLTMTVTTANITEKVKTKLRDLLISLFKDQPGELLYAVLMTCPWYACTQKEIGEQAKHNVLYVVFKASLSQYLSPLTSHALQHISVVDMDWFVMHELSHFVNLLSTGKTRPLENLYSPSSAILYQTEPFVSLRESLDPLQMMGLKTFLDACHGQSTNVVAKKRRDRFQKKVFTIEPTTTLQELCDAFRLMHHAHNLSLGLPLSKEPVNVETLPDVAREAVVKLQSMYKNDDASLKYEAFELLKQWQEEVDEKMKDFQRTDKNEVQRIIGDWHMSVKLGGKTIQNLTCAEDERSKLLLLMEEIGGPVARLRPEQILLIAQAGSHMYGLSTSTSDVDYVIVYTETTERILTACQRVREIIESRGPSKQIEYGAYEARCFAEMLLKGSVMIQELIFKDDHKYMSPAWLKLAQNRHLFVTEKALHQYLGLVKSNLKAIEKGKHKGAPQERKLFYQVFHKLDSMEYFLQGTNPPVLCTGPVRDFIIRVRTAPLEGDLSREALLEYAQSKLKKMKKDLANRPKRLPELGDFNFLEDWLLSLRGLSDTT